MLEVGFVVVFEFVELAVVVEVVPVLVIIVVVVCGFVGH